MTCSVAAVFSCSNPWLQRRGSLLAALDCGDRTLCWFFVAGGVIEGTQPLLLPQEVQEVLRQWALNSMGAGVLPAKH